MADIKQFVADLRGQARLAAIKGDEYTAYFHGAAADRLEAAEGVVEAACLLFPQISEDDLSRLSGAIEVHDDIWGRYDG